MQVRLLAITALVAIWGCSAPHDDVQLRQLAVGLSEAWPRATWDLSLTIVANDQSGKTVLHCVLMNTSAEPINVDASTLPWIAPGLFNVNAVTAGGTVIRRHPVTTQPVNLPRIVTIGVGESLEGDFDLTQLPIGVETPPPRSEDLLLLWSYSLGDWSSSLDGRPSRSYFVSGTTLLMKM